MKIPPANPPPLPDVMTIHDYYASQALIGFVLAHCIAGGPDMTADEMADAALRVADAVMKVREKRQ